MARMAKMTRIHILRMTAANERWLKLKAEAKMMKTRLATYRATNADGKQVLIGVWQKADEIEVSMQIDTVIKVPTLNEALKVLESHGIKQNDLERIIEVGGLSILPELA